MRLAPGDERERERRVDEPDEDEPQAAPPDLADGLRPAALDDHDRESTAAARTSRSAIIGTGSISRSATLMNMYDAPQIAASQDQHEEVAAGHAATLPTRPSSAQAATLGGPDARSRNTAPPRARSDGRGVRPHPGVAGARPNHFELAVFSLLWSEHCGYKHSALAPPRLPTRGQPCSRGPGENAGVVDLGDGEAVAFKVESHNHPSAVEPFQGAATGVGGILRDIIAMGARPVAILDGLRFGAPDFAF